MWNGVYCLGSAMGPLAAVLMYDAVGWGETIIALMAVGLAVASVLTVVALAEPAVDEQAEDLADLQAEEGGTGF